MLDVLSMSYLDVLQVTSGYLKIILCVHVRGTKACWKGSCGLEDKSQKLPVFFLCLCETLRKFLSVDHPYD